MIIKKTKLSKAIAMTLAGTALSAGVVSTASAHVMYNTFTTAAVADTDGWNYVYDNGVTSPGVATGPESSGYLGTQVPWLGTTGGALPFGYTGRAHLNWAAEIHAVGDVLDVSAADAAADYSGAVVEIDTGAGAWKDNSASPTGWKHQTDLGLIMSHVDTLVRLNLSRIGTPSTPGLVNDNFGITVFKGMDTTSSVGYSHHGGWNSATKPETTSNPFYAAGVGSGMTYLTHDATVDSINYLEFFAEAGKVYTIALGGAGVGSWSQNISDYALTVASVPVPAAVWLLGSALAGMGIIGRRRETRVA